MTGDKLAFFKKSISQLGNGLTNSLGDQIQERAQKQSWRSCQSDPGLSIAYKNSWKAGLEKLSLKLKEELEFLNSKSFWNIKIWSNKQKNQILEKEDNLLQMPAEINGRNWKC